MKAIYERELRSYFTSMTGWLFCAFLLFFGGLYTNILNLSSGYAQFEYVLSNMSFAFLIVTPIITMRTVAEERRQKTDQLLYSLPITMTQVILGKYLALLTVLAVPTGVMAFYPVVLSQFGSVSYATAYSSLLGFFLMGAALVAVGLCISAFTENQAVAAALCFVVVLLNYYLTSISTFVSSTPQSSLLAGAAAVFFLSLVVLWMTRSGLAAIAALVAAGGLLVGGWLLSPESFEGLVPGIMNKRSLFDRFYTFVDGVFDLTSVVFFLTVIGFCLFLAVQTMEKRRWSE